MKALVYTDPFKMSIQDRPYPKLSDGEIIVKIDAAGICGSDMHAYHGQDPRRFPGLVLGHELAGKVVESASGHMSVGTRVTVNPLITCGTCEYCQQSRDNLCENRGMVGMTRAGAFAEYMSIPASCAIELPQGMLATHAALAEPAATALHAINLSMRAMSRPLPEQRALVVGGGAIGLLCALLLRSYGCRHVDVAETNELRRELISQHVGHGVFNPTMDPVKVSNYSYVIDAVGSALTRQASLEAVDDGGVVMHIGLTDWASEIDMRKLTLSEICLLGTYTYTMSDMRAAVAAIYEGAFGDLSWVQTMPLSKGAEAFASLDAGSVATSKLVLLPHAEIM